MKVWLVTYHHYEVRKLMGVWDSLELAEKQRDDMPSPARFWTDIVPWEVNGDEVENG